MKKLYKDVTAALLLLIATLLPLTAAAQGTVKGRAVSKTTNESLPFVNVKVTNAGNGEFAAGAITDEKGTFNITGLKNGKYNVTLSYVGYKNAVKTIEVSAQKPHHNLQAIYLADDSHTLQEVKVTGRRSEMKLEVDRKTFSVDQVIANSGGTASDVLNNIPSVEIDNDGTVSLKGNSSVEVWINGKASGLTSDNRGEILQQMPAESIEKIEVIDNPSSKYSAEGTAGIINIVLKRDRKAGYYGSVQAGVRTTGGYNLSGNINYSSGLFDAYANISYRRGRSKGGAISQQEYFQNNQYQNYESESLNKRHNVFGRFGGTYHPTKFDDITLGFMGMIGGSDNNSDIPYHYGTIGATSDSRLTTRHSNSKDKMRMLNFEAGYKHQFGRDTHFIDFSFNGGNWRMDNDNYYQDSTVYFDTADPNEYVYQYRPMFMRNRRYEVRLDYENKIDDHWKVQAGYNGDFSHENTPQESWVDSTDYFGSHAVEDEQYFNRFIYDNQIHSLYAIATFNTGKFGVQAGLRGEYWKVNTESYNYQQEKNPELRTEPFKKDYFQLFPSLFLSYQITPTQQLQLNYTRRLRRPWGGQLNSFKNTRDATIVEYGNPQLTPEFTNSFSLNYLKTWDQHTLSLSAYYRPTTDVIQRIRYQSSTDGMMYSTNENVAKSVRTGLEIVVKNKFWKCLDLTSTVNLYYYHLNGFEYVIDGQTVTGDSDNSFTWSARVLASLILPYDISLQSTFNLRSREVVSQGYRKSNYNIELGLRKSFFDKKLSLSINCRDVLNSRRWKTITSSDTFSRYQENWRHGREVNFTLTWNFGNMKSKKPQREGSDESDSESFGGYEN